MFFIPLSQPESVELVIHALRVAGGQADCSSCPVRKVCMKQCLTIADAVDNMVKTGNLPSFGPEAEPAPAQPTPQAPAAEAQEGEKPKGGHLKIVK